MEVPLWKIPWTEAEEDEDVIMVEKNDCLRLEEG